MIILLAENLYGIIKSHFYTILEHQDRQAQWRRGKMQELCSKGYSQREISQTLQVGLATVNRDIAYLRNQAKTNITATSHNTTLLWYSKT